MSFKHAMGTSVTEEASEVSVNSGERTAVYSCPQDGLGTSCVFLSCVFLCRLCLSKTLRLCTQCTQYKVYTVTRETFANGFSKNGIQDLLGGSPDKSPRGVSGTKGGMGYQGS